MALDNLTQEQLNAVKHGSGPLLIIAGAGTGKTTVITERIKYLLLEKKIDPSEVLALTFTEKASYEMQERLDILLPYGYSDLWINTFHSFCDRILRNEVHNMGLDPNYRLITDSESDDNLDQVPYCGPRFLEFDRRRNEKYLSISRYSHKEAVYPNAPAFRRKLFL